MRNIFQMPTHVLYVIMQWLLCKKVVKHLFKDKNKKFQVKKGDFDWKSREEPKKNTPDDQIKFEF